MQPNHSVSLVRYSVHLNDVVAALLDSQDYQPLCDINTLPKIGFIAYHNTSYVAMGFLRMVEGGFAQIDTLCTNPQIPGEIRHEAINAIGEALLNEARGLEVRAVMFFTSSDQVMARTADKGFVALKTNLYAKVLK